ncbi:streptolysin associated protein SagC [Longispora fulva]|uniref:Thiazole/oxazole-forming peptide maturase SagC family component n=1 Tax=Longispora fulva TaxID=619741 RepID=A0A8J7KVH8_9ACTN|nr:TOMM precursor leader peptide-binding protein [Longispora fulva]MBG6135317.1 thiazole/oxazole-forming peptide maturase SagC family component [Longispora fulva]GIG56444.1 streptolysin associated protein SagC [Longispora fulva]
MEYRLGGTVRIIEDGQGRIRLRTGVWNYEEAVIDVSRESPAVAGSVRSALRALALGRTEVGAHLDPGLLPIERANVEKLFVDLEQAGMLVTAVAHTSQEAITAALLGRLRSPYPGSPEPPTQELLFATDCAASLEQARNLAAGMRARFTSLDPAVLEELASGDLTTRIDGYGTEAAIERLRPALTGRTVVTCFQRPSLPQLRNLNRVLEGTDTAWISAFIDGPFLSVVGLRSPYTGCFECFEQRALARLEDHVSYHDFARGPIGRPEPGDTDAPMMATLTVLAVTEGYLHASVGSSRLSGRVLSIHLPTMEIQAQDLLRMPSCPACGRVARQRVREINFSSRSAVDRIISGVLR